MKRPLGLALALVVSVAAPARAQAPAPTALAYVEYLYGATNVNAIAGHGQLTAGVSVDGDLTVLAWPSPGFADQLSYLSSNALDARAQPHLGADDSMGSYLGLLVTQGAGPPTLTWLRDSAWTHTQSYSQPDAPVPVTRFDNAALGLTVTLTDVVSPDSDVLTRHVGIDRHAGSPVTALSLVVYENLSPTLSQVPEVPLADWGLDSQNDFLAAWDDTAHAIVHFHPGDRAVLKSLFDLIPLDKDVDYGAIDPLMKGTPDVAAAQTFLGGLDAAYPAGVAGMVTTEPAPTDFQVGSDATPLCARQGQILDNILALPMRFPTVQVPLDAGSANMLRCTGTLADLRMKQGWTWTPGDALADLADGTLSRSPLAAGQTNGALIAPLSFTGDHAEGSALFAFGATLAAARTTLAAATAKPFTDRLAASEKAAHDVIGGLALPDPALGPRVTAVALRALVNLYVARDRATGALLASVTRQSPYYLDWPRDGAFLTTGLDLAGRTDWVTQRDLWYATVQRDSFTEGTKLLTPTAPTDPTDGRMLFPRWVWEMNYYVSGDIGGPIRFEIDNTALHLWATVVHAATLEGAARKSFADAVWETDKDALSVLIRWKDAATGLPAPANEDDHTAFTSTLHGAVAVYAGLVAGERLARFEGDDATASAAADRATELRAAILANYYDATTGLFRGERGMPGGPEDTIGGWATGWLVWPARLLDPGDPRLERQLSSDMDGVLAILHGQKDGGTYVAKNVVAAALYGKDGAGGARDKARQAVLLLADVATADTAGFGEVFLNLPGSGDPPKWENRTATPHIWEGMLFYLSAMALSEPKAFNPEERAFPLAGEGGGCGCRTSDPRGIPGGAATLVFAVGFICLWRRRKPRR